MKNDLRLPNVRCAEWLGWIMVNLDRVCILFGGGMSPEYVDHPEAQTRFQALKSLLDDVNLEDRGCTDTAYRGLCASFARPGPLSRLERPNHDFARYLASRTSTFSLSETHDNVPA